MITPLCRSGARDRDVDAPALLPTAATGTSRRALASADQRPVAVCGLTAIAPGDLISGRERGWPRLAVVDSLERSAHAIPSEISEHSAWNEWGREPWNEQEPVIQRHGPHNCWTDAWGADGAQSKRAAAPLTAPTLAAHWKVVIDDKEMGVATPESIESIASNRRAELHAMWIRATSPASPGGQQITNDEALAIYHYDRTEFAPAFVVMSTSWAAIRGIVGGSQGVYAPRVIRRLRALWASRKESNVIPFPAREEEGPEAA